MSDFCDPMCPFLGCTSCAYSGGGSPAAATESAPVSGVACETMGARKTAPAGNRGLTTETSEESKWL